MVDLRIAYIGGGSRNWAGSKDLAFQAVFNDPTTALPIDKAWAMFNEIGLPPNW